MHLSCNPAPLRGASPIDPSVPAHSDLSAEHCRFMAARALEASGVRVDPSRRDFFQLRISRRLTALRLTSFADYVSHLKSDTTGEETRHLVEALTTHTTSFFRERHHYDWLTSSGLEMLCANGAGRQRPLVVWSAACSTGAELWTAAMVIAEATRLSASPGRVAFIGTDISRKILKKAAGATYTETEIDSVGAELRNRYLMKSRRLLDHGRGALYRVVPELRAQASFEPANLSDLSSLRSFSADVIFLRNVLIYFKADLQAQVLNDVIARLRPGGVLMTGHAEAVPTRRDLRTLGPSLYQKV